MVLTWLREIHEHRWLALRAIVVGWVAWWVLWIAASWLVLDFDDWLFVGGVADIRWFWRILRTPVFHVLVGAAVAAGTGLAVGRSDRAHRVPMVLLFFSTLMIIGDLPRFITAALGEFGPGHGRFWWIVALDFVFMRVPIVMAGIWGVQSWRGVMVRSRAVLLLALAAAWCIDGAVAAQTPAVPTFEAAIIKRNVSGGPRSGTGIMPGGHVTITNQTLRQIIRSAYGSEDIEVLGGPDWIGADRWDIVATAGTGAADPPWRVMLKSLLTERFMLQAHAETRERPIYSLVLARGDKQLGPGIHPSLADLACGANDLCGSTKANTNGIASGVITGTSRSIADIAQSLSRYAERRVFDRTGLEGRYDFELQWSDVSIFTALQEQLGLKLEPTKGPVDVVVIDRVERPTEN